MDAQSLLAELVATPGPAGQEEAVRNVVAKHVKSVGFELTVDAKGNLLVPLGKESPKVVVTAHLDEIALIVRGIYEDGTLQVGPLGGIHPWKQGEGPVQILAAKGPLTGILGFGSIHTEDPASTVRQADDRPLRWDDASVWTGLSASDLIEAGVRAGTRVVVHPSRRGLVDLGSHLSGYFLDDRADLVAWLLTLGLELGNVNALFAATAAEEVGGEGAQYLLHRVKPEVVIALELGPNVPDAPVEVSDQPTVWVQDSFSTLATADIDWLAGLGHDLGFDLQFQALSRGGSDASIAATHGLCARGITLGIPMENSHGFEIIHRDSMTNLARLTQAMVQALG